MAVVFTISTDTGELRLQLASCLVLNRNLRETLPTRNKVPSVTKPGLVCDAGVLTHRNLSSAILNTPATDPYKDCR